MKVMGRHDSQVITIIASTLKDDPSASINDLCRACVDAGLSVTKPYVARMRKQFVKSVLRDDSVDMGDGTHALYVRHAPDEMVRRDPEKLARERAEKARREADREAEQRARQAEREAQWAAEREAQARADASARASWAPGQPLPPIEALQGSEPGPEGAPAPAGATIPTPPGSSEGVPSSPAGAPASADPSAQTDPSALTPGRRAQATRRAMCRQHLNELLDADPGMAPQAAAQALREKFGVGLDIVYVYETCRVAREIAGLPPIPSKRPYAKTPGLTREMHPGTPVGDLEPWNEFDAQFDTPAQTSPAALTYESGPAPTPEEDLAWLVRQARDVMRAHNLSTLALDVTEKEGEWLFTEKPRTKSGKTRF